MCPRICVPELTHPITIRLARNSEEITAANDIVHRNYVEKGYWEDDKDALTRNPYLHSPARTVFVMLDGSRVIGSASIIEDSRSGLPADRFQAPAMRRLRAGGERIAEVSALAVEPSMERSTSLVLFLFKYVYQYSFYHAGIDRFVVVSTRRHAIFYEKVCLFERVLGCEQYGYVNVEAQLLTVDLLQAHRLFTEKYGPPEAPDSFYRFLLLEAHPCLEFPPTAPARSRAVDWLTQARVAAFPPPFSLPPTATRKPWRNNML